ncbi:MAG: polysaccharide deacetylase family protein [Clostridium sp.]|jgi:peptidoglycan/xylan/chitin deacetylase (PgdA/CDA1 family)|nr:polysaccharide deacetylase family protein [Clostridium sp.]
MLKKTNLFIILMVCFIALFMVSCGNPETIAPVSGDGSPSNEPSQDIKKQVALTFDDGPHPLYTEQLLDGLKERGAKVTFFLMGKNAQLYPELVERMNEEGHLVGNHTYSHLGLTTANHQAFLEEVEATNDVIEEITGKTPEYLRPPYGTWDVTLEDELEMFAVLWNVDPLDWCSTDVKNITNNVINKVKDGDIVLMHDFTATSVTAALDIVDHLLEEGYEFVTVEDIFLE